MQRILLPSLAGKLAARRSAKGSEADVQRAEVDVPDPGGGGAALTPCRIVPSCSTGTMKRRVALIEIAMLVGIAIAGLMLADMIYDQVMRRLGG